MNGHRRSQYDIDLGPFIDSLFVLTAYLILFGGGVVISDVLLPPRPEAEGQAKADEITTCRVVIRSGGAVELHLAEKDTVQVLATEKASDPRAVNGSLREIFSSREVKAIHLEAHEGSPFGMAAQVFDVAEALGVPVRIRFRTCSIHERSDR